MPASVMDGNGVSNHLGTDGAGTAPGANDFLITTFVHGFDFLE
jgi:hypothetical protein